MNVNSLVRKSTNLFPSDKPRPKIPAKILVRAIKLAHARHTKDTKNERTFTLSHARITGRVDLANLFRDRQTGLIGLIFIGCVFEDEVDFTSSTLQGLLFQKCQLRIVTAKDCKIFGQVEFDQVQSSEHRDNRTGQRARNNWPGARGPVTAEFDAKGTKEKIPPPPEKPLVEGKTPQGLCRLNFINAELDQSFAVKRSLICGSPLREGLDPSNSIKNYALDLAGSRVGKSINLMDNTAVLGGFSISGAQIDGNVYLAGSKFLAGEGDAIYAQLARVSGFMALRNVNPPGETVQRFEAHGLVNMLDISVRSSIDLSGGRFIGDTSTRNALIVAGSAIGSLIAGNDASDPPLATEIVGIVHAQNCQIKNDLQLTAISIRPPRVDRPGVKPLAETEWLAQFNGCRIGGKAHLEGDIRGPILFNEVQVENSLNLGVGAPLRLISSPVFHDILALRSSSFAMGLNVGKVDIDTRDSWAAMRRAMNDKSKISARVTPVSFAENAELWEFQIKYRDRPHYGAALKLGKKFHLLDGKGPSIMTPLYKYGAQLDTDSEQLEYLRLFCGLLMADAGHFNIVEPGGWLCAALPDNCSADVTPLSIISLEKVGAENPQDYLYAASAVIWYGNALFRAIFAVKRQGLLVEMLNDEPIHQDLISITWPADPLYFVEDDAPEYSKEWRRAPVLSEKVRFDHLPKTAKQAITDATGNSEALVKLRPTISLRDTKVGKLSDDSGNNWPSTVRLDLSGFTYDALDIPDTRNQAIAKKQNKEKINRMKWKNPAAFWTARVLALGFLIWMVWIAMQSTYQKFISNQIVGSIILVFLAVMLVLYIKRSPMKVRRNIPAWKSRRRWLKLQFIDNFPTKDEFNPQPLEQLARVFRHQGQEEDYRRISRLKTKWYNQTMTGPILRPFMWLSGFAFGYGFSVYRSSFTFIALVALGVWATQVALERNILVLNTSPDTAVVNRDAQEIANLRCKDEILPLLFALDKFVPLIELGQEKLCRVRADMREGSDGSFWSANILDRPKFWQIASSVFKLLGWIVSSVLVLTFSKTIRRSTGE